jgi:hypothetical protein
MGYPDSAHYPRIPYRIRIRYGCDSRAMRTRYSSWRIRVSWQLRYAPIRSDMPRYAPNTPPIRPWYFFKIFWWIRSRIRPRYSSICPDTPLIRPRVKFISCPLCCYSISVIYISIEYNNFSFQLYLLYNLFIFLYNNLLNITALVYDVF